MKEKVWYYLTLEHTTKWHDKKRQNSYLTSSEYVAKNGKTIGSYLPCYYIHYRHTNKKNKRRKDL